MIPEFLTEATNANVLVLCLSENMNSYRERTLRIPVPRWLSRWLAALPKWLSALYMLTVGQVVCLVILPMLWRSRAETDKIVNLFRDIDILQYNEERADKLCRILAGQCDLMDEAIRQKEELQVHRVLALRWEYKKHVLAKQELEDILETWILARNSEFQEIFRSVLGEFKQYIKTVEASMTNSD